MEPASLLLTLFLAGSAAVVGVGGFLVWKHSHEFRDAHEPYLRSAWVSAATRLDLKGIEKGRSLAGLPYLTARMGQLMVRLDKVPIGTLAGTQVTIRGLGHGDQPLEVHKESDEIGAGRRLFERDLRIGAEDFDRTFRIVGPVPLALAVLDGETRPRLAEVLGGSLSLKGQPALAALAVLRTNQLTVAVAHPKAVLRKDLGEQVLGALEAVLDLAARLAKPQDVAVRLADNLRHEAEAQVRHNCLDLLLREYPDHSATREALALVREDSDGELRYEAAVASGKEGRETLRQLVTSETASEACAVRAVEALGVFLTVEEAAEKLRKNLRFRRSEVARALIETITRHGRLGRRGDAELEELLIAILEEPTPKLVLAVAEALGAVGSVAAVPALRAVEDGGGRQAARAARQAIAEIQGRLEGAEHGQLSLTGSEAGALSLLGEDPAGRLSLPQQGVGLLPTRGE